MRHSKAGNGRIAETEDFSVVQMSNGHIHVSGKTSGLAMHISATVMYPQETLQALPMSSKRHTRVESRIHLRRCRR